jgi:hypothetical protein
MTSKNDSSQNATKTMLRRTDFDKQLTQDLMERVLKQTIQLVKQVERHTPWRDLSTPDDRLHTAIVQTLDGTRAWDPERVNLGGHLFGIVSSDISHEVARSEKYDHCSLDDDEHQDLEALREETEDALARCAPTSDEVPTDSVWTLAIEALRRAADGETAVLRILDAYDDDAFDPREVKRFTRLRTKAYEAAYTRLIELASELDDDVRDLILQAIA